MKTATTNITAVIDRLGSVKGAIADLKAEEDALKDILIDAGIDAAEGNLYRVAITRNDGRTTVDWRSIAAKFEPSRQLVTANTTTGEPFYTIRVSARTGDK